MTFSTQSVAEMVGTTKRALQWWDEQGIITPTRFGRNRTYTRGEVRMIALITQMREAGVSLQTIRRVLPDLRKSQDLHRSKYILLVGSNGANAQKAYVENDEKAIIQKSLLSRKPVRLFSIKNVFQNLVI